MKQASWLVPATDLSETSSPVGPYCPWPQDPTAAVEQWPSETLQLPQRELWCEVTSTKHDRGLPKEQQAAMRSSGG